MKIEKPNWWNDNDMPDESQEVVDRLWDWFKEHVEPVNKMLAEGSEVIQHRYCMYWDLKNCPVTEGREPVQKALLINIQPIKHETCADVLRNIIKRAGEKDNMTDLTVSDMESAKAALERGEK